MCSMMCKEQCKLTREPRKWTKCPALYKRNLLRRKYKKHLLNSLQPTKSKQTTGSVLAERIEQVKETEFELDLINIVNCYLDGHVKYDSIIKSFGIQFL